MSERVYIAGPMTGLPDLNFPAFERAAARLRESGYTVISPHEVCPDKGMAWADALRRDIPALCTCTVVALLPGWQKSKGATLEKAIADALGMRVIFVDHFAEIGRS